MHYRHHPAPVRRQPIFACKPELFLLFGIWAIGQFPNIAFAQTPDTLRLNNGNTLIGYILPFTCAAKPTDQQFSFQPVGGLPLQTPGLVDVAGIQLGNFALNPSDLTSRPTPGEIVSIRGYLRTKSRRSEEHT